MNMRRKNITVIALGVIVMVLLIGSTAFAIIRNSPPKFSEVQERLHQMTDEEHQAIAEDARENQLEIERKFAEQLRAANMMPREIVAQVNGEDVLASDLVRQKAFLEKQGSNKILPFDVTEDSVIKDVIKEKTIIAEAKKRGLFPTPLEIDEYIKWQRNMLKEALSDTENPAQQTMNKDVWDSYLSGLGVIEQEFWTNIAPEEYAKGLTTVKLRNSIIKDVPQKDATQAWDSFTEKLISNAKVTVINPDIFNY